jgi:hypothetical protein
MLTELNQRTLLPTWFILDVSSPIRKLERLLR